MDNEWKRKGACEFDGEEKRERAVHPGDKMEGRQRQGVWVVVTSYSTVVQISMKGME